MGINLYPLAMTNYEVIAAILCNMPIFIEIILKCWLNVWAACVSHDDPILLQLKNYHKTKGFLIVEGDGKEREGRVKQIWLERHPDKMVHNKMAQMKRHRRKAQTNRCNLLTFTFTLPEG